MMEVKAKQAEDLNKTLQYRPFSSSQIFVI
jgi:hypothetical protein